MAELMQTAAEKKPTKSAKEQLDAVKKLVDSVDNTAADREDVINLAYVKGKQWIGWDRARSRVFEPPVELVNGREKTRHVENRLRPLIQRQKARIFRNKPMVDVIPATPEIADVESARIAKKILDWLDYAKGLQKRNASAVLWGLCTRVAFIHPYWNAGLGADAGEGLKEGDIDFDVLSPFEVKFDNSAATWEDVRWACKMKVRDVDYIESTYGAKVDPEKGLTASNIYDTKMSFAAMQDNIKYTPLEHHARVYEFWELPSSDYPKGRRVAYTMNRDEPLFTADDIGFGEQDDTERQLPFFPFVAIDIPGSVSGTNKVTDCRPIQREINRTRSQIIDNKDLTAYPKLAIESGSLDDDWDNEIGGTVEYGQGSKPPSYIQPPAAGVDAYQNLQQLYEAFDFVSGMSQASLGKMPTDSSGYMMQLAIEQDDTEFAPTIENWINCEQAYKAYALKMIHFNYQDNRQLKIVGKDGVEILSVSGANFNTWDVRLQRGSLLASSPTVRRAEIFNLINATVLNPQQDKDEILGHLEFGMVDEMYSEAELDRRQARKEERGWENGVQEDPRTAVRDFFNHRVHIKEHNRWRKTQAYEQLPPEQQGYIDAHVQAHEIYMQTQMMEAAMLQAPQMPMQGAQSFGTPHSPDKLQEQIGSGRVVGNSMQGAPQGGMPNG